MSNQLFDNPSHAEDNLFYVFFDELHFAGIYIGIFCLPHQSLVVTHGKSSGTVADRLELGMEILGFEINSLIIYTCQFSEHRNSQGSGLFFQHVIGGVSPPLESAFHSVNFILNGVESLV
jgi:hypothetical protein